MKKLTPEGQRRIRDKAAKRWVKDRRRIFPTTALLMLFGAVMGGQIGLDAYGQEHALAGAYIGTIAGFVVGWAYIMRRKG